MGQQDIHDKLKAAVDFLADHPEEARYTDSFATARVSGTDSLKVEVSGPDNARLTTDMVESVGGSNTAPSPGWVFRAAQASGVATLIVMRAAMLQLSIEAVEVTVDSQSDDWGILGIGDVQAAPLSTRVAVKVRAPGADRAALEDLVRWAVDHAPQIDAVRRQIPTTIEIDAG